MTASRISFARHAVWLASLWAVLALAGCVSTQGLDDYELENRSLAIMAAIPDDPIVFHELLAARGVRPYDPYGRQATGYEDAELHRARTLEDRLRSAARQVEVARLIAQETGARSAEILGMHLVDDPDAADYVLDVRVYDYGLLMLSARERVAFFIDAELLLISNETGETVWKEELEEATSSRHTVRPHRIEQDELAEHLAGFAAHTSERLLRMLERAWRRV